MPVISIVIPVYNAEKYLERCIYSALSQSYRDFELILVDDGSQDGSGDICDRFANVDSRVKVYHKVNEGVSSARNKGIEEATGTFICFVDSDDWLETSYLQNFIEVEPHKYGVVLQSFYYDYEDGRKSKPHIFSKKEISTASELEYYLEFTKGVHNGFLWHRLFHLDIIKRYNLRYCENISFAEDGLFFLNYIEKTERFIIINNAGYHYLVRAGSLTSKGKSLPKDVYFFLMEEYSSVTKRIIDKDQPEHVIRNGLKLFLWRLIYGWMLQRSMNCKHDYFENLRRFQKILQSYEVDNHVSGIPFPYYKIIDIVCSSPTTLKYYELKIWMYIYRMHIRVGTLLGN